MANTKPYEDNKGKKRPGSGYGSIRGTTPTDSGRIGQKAKRLIKQGKPQTLKSWRGSFLIDTNVLKTLFKRASKVRDSVSEGQNQLAEQVKSLPVDRLRYSTVIEAELNLGNTLLNNEQLERFLSGLDCIALTPDIEREMLRLSVTSIKNVKIGDLLIGATARVSKSCVITNNAKDFGAMGIDYLELV